MLTPAPQAELPRNNGATNPVMLSFVPFQMPREAIAANLLRHENH